MGNSQKSYNQLIEFINTFADNHKQIKQFDNGFRFDLNRAITEETSFPIIYVEAISHTMQDWTQIYSIRLYCLDIKQKDSSNETEIISDTLQILNDTIKYIRNDADQIWDVLNQPVAIPVTNYGTEFTTGWFCDMDIEASINDTDCDIPIITD